MHRKPHFEKRASCGKQDALYFCRNTSPGTPAGKLCSEKSRPRTRNFNLNIFMITAITY
ncbi:hypothetical protein D3OALGA1CA_5824 [Olavius algarvensis associated proteobacterium Delta 3]|nr:hypothetical protein D3OALGB2SA_1253 [Olavius algarvensis associated proteobacterium Delta 3]CAB5172320.1 hypothetical protein D3OALGA1CA_5824 [Olavius algarvensis associated proteobacterium Delta 3]